jgi:hypothetical protein
MATASILVIVIVSIASLVGVVSALFWGKDNRVEQEMEEIIKDLTGDDVDLSPEEKQKKKEEEKKKVKEKEKIASYRVDIC